MSSAIFCCQNLTLLHVLLLLMRCQRTAGIIGKSQMCEVVTGQTNIILDIEESRGDSIDQRTQPPELPIYGDPYTEIALDLIFPNGNPIFRLDGKQLQLTQPLDRDEEDLSHIVYQVSCKIRGTNRKRTIPIIVRVSDVNDNAPQFVNAPYRITVPKSTPVGTTIFRNIQALDKDAGVNGLVEYSIVAGNTNVTEFDSKMTAADGYGIFEISYPHQGQLTLAKTLAYEKIQRYYLTIVASDRALNTSARLSSTTTLTVNIADSHDLGLSFTSPEYTASVAAGSLPEVLTVAPERIQVIDSDMTNSELRYTFANGMPDNYADYFKIDEQTGVIKQIKTIETLTTIKYEIIVKVEETSQAKRFTTAKLIIMVEPFEIQPSFIQASKPEGNKVLDFIGKPIVFRRINGHVDENEYVHELTTVSSPITTDRRQTKHEVGLDFDTHVPKQFKFQVVTLDPKINTPRAPLNLSIPMVNVNDNIQKLHNRTQVSIAAGDYNTTIPRIFKVEDQSEPDSFMNIAHKTDFDEATNAEIKNSKAINVPFMLDNMSKVVTSSSNLDFAMSAKAGASGYEQSLWITAYTMLVLVQYFGR